MIDIKWIRDNPHALDKSLARRGDSALSEYILALDAQNRDTQTALQKLRAEKNSNAKKMGATKKNSLSVERILARGSAIKKEIERLEGIAQDLKKKILDTLSHLPNPILETIPHGISEANNVEIRQIGTLPSFTFIPKEHYDLGESLGLMDFSDAAQISGSRFVVLKGALAKLERALAQFMLDTHTERYGYEETSVPLLVKADALYGTGQLPKFSADLFTTTQGHWLIPTGEVPLTNLGADRIFLEDSLPKRFTALTPCFRSEAGAAGRDTRGMLRQHQFYKVELVSICHPNTSLDEFNRMVSAAEYILKELKIPYRVMDLCDGDIGFHSKRTLDIEGWFPGQKIYRELSSCSLCGDFQARRMNGRFRNANNPKDVQFFHTLNGSGLAVGRTLIAVMENYQQEDGSIIIPDALHPYMGGVTCIT